MAETRVGVLGAGFIATKHVAALQQVPCAEVVAVADPQQQRAAELAATCGATPHAGLDEMLDAHDLDALYVCVPPHLHGPPERAAIDRGIPLFVEKPLAADFPAAEAIAADLAGAGLPAAVGYHWRYLDTLATARRLLRGAPPRMVIGAWLDKTPGAEWWSRQSCSGGQTIEQVTHLFDVARLLAGEVVSVRADGTRAVDGPGDIVHASTSTVRFASGAVGSFSSTCLLPRGFRIGVEAFAPGLALGLTEHELVVSDREGQQTILAAVDPFVAEDRAFVAAIRGEDGDVRAPYADALRTHRLATAVATAVETGGTVELSAAEP